MLEEIQGIPVQDCVMSNISSNIKEVCQNLSDFLLEKNNRYGNSVMNDTLRVFSKHSTDDPVLNAILSRLDDKLSRINNSTELRKNDVVDFLGYLPFLCIRKGWKTFDDLLD
jgi:hypothetical protein